ncbi:hypothetical protein ACU4M6_001978 [Raoultella ornithinolytica]|uniref:hypothetical protein n=1 Tax=Raoultella ornithinolytica TaxID=54291 RepID=UPI00259EA7BD|nr:hypothetical protein [Raoultella ornithinolytica]EKW3194555.1 hypothetical protein [Raoultella ornithinolytica]EKY4178746.1 hypothetical protein [Raoultella ornithinolytica]ELS5378642.1 hypothetical protein [Raoultella ornithinolytica]
MGKDTNYQVVYRGETLPHYIPGGWVFFQRPKECGGGFWLGKTFDAMFMLEMDRPVSLHDGLCYIVQHTNVSENFMDFDDDFTLT